MNDHMNRDCACMDDWLEIEARFRRAKQSLLHAQERHCEATREFLAARAQLQQFLEAVFPEQGTRQTQ